ADAALRSGGDRPHDAVGGLPPRDVAAAALHPVRLHLHHHRAVAQDVRLHLHHEPRRAGRCLRGPDLPAVQDQLPGPQSRLRRRHVVLPAGLDSGDDDAAVCPVGTTRGAMRSKVWAGLALAVAILWTLLPLYWFLKLAFETIGEGANYPPYFFPPY